MSALQPTKRKRQETDYSCCIICQNQTSEGSLTRKPQIRSYENVLACSRQRVEYGDRQYADLSERLENMSADDLAQNSAMYHRDCYQSLTSALHLERAKHRFEKTSCQRRVAVARSQIGRPKLEEEPMASTSDERVHRSSIAPLNKDLCIFCQEETPDNEPHNISSRNIGSMVKTAVEDSQDITLKVRLGSLLSDPLDAVAHDMKWHVACLTSVERQNEKQMKKTQASEDRSRLGCVIADIEIVSLVENALKDPSSIVLDMNVINTTYLNILEENNIETEPSDNYKRHLKDLMKTNITDIEFVKPKRRNEPEKFCSKSTLGVCLDIAEKSVEDDSEMKMLLKSATVLRKEIGDSKAWAFQGSFGDYAVPQKLYTFIKWVIEGPHAAVQTDRKQAVIHKSASNISQHIVTAYKSDRQVKYISPIEDDKFKPSGETAFSLGVSLLLHQQTRKKSLVDIASRLGIGERYSRVLRLEAQLANAVAKRLNDFNGLYIPPFVVKKKSVYFAIDNVDFLEDTPTGKDTLHGTAIVMYQKEMTTGETIVSALEVEGIGKKTEPMPFNLLPCQAPKPKLEPIPDYIISTRHGISEVYRIWDLAWIIACCIGSQTNENEDAEEGTSSSDVLPANAGNRSDDVDTDRSTFLEKDGDTFSQYIPTWSAYNSLITEAGTKTNVAVVPPLIRHSPTSWPGLYTALMRAQNISVVVVGEGKPTVVTLDLQLYEKAQKLMSRDDMKGKFVLRIGELHTIFSALKAIGWYIECSGIDQLWVEAGMYSPTTVRQIIEGKHLYRAMEAHMVTLITLYSLLLPALWDNGIEGKTEVEKAASEVNLSAKNATDRTLLQESHVSLVGTLEKVDFVTNLNSIDEHLRGMHCFLRNYMRQFECILRHIRASRKGEWQLHLTAQEELCKYFFAHDHLNYARLSPLYCAEMRKLETNDPDTWKALEDGDFCVTKSNIPFCSIGPDHGIEHENRAMKVIGGITGITQKEATLDKFFLIAPELARLVNEFGDLNGVKIKEERKKHHDLTGSARSGLFGDDEEETVENAFKYAVYRVSHERGLLINTQMQYDIQRLPVFNTFDSSKKVCSQIALETVAIFGPDNRDLAAFTDSVCSTVRIPHIEYRLDSNNYPPAGYSVNIHPDAELLAKAYLDVIQYFGWTEVLILYSNQEGLLKVQSLLRASNQTIDMSVIVRQADLDNMRAVLKEAKHNYWTHIIAELNITETGLLLKMALQEGMIDPYHHYILTNMDIELLDLEDYRHNFVNLTSFRLVKTEDEFTRKIMDDIYLYSENTQLPILNGPRLSYKCALVFDAVYLFAKAMKELDRSVMLLTPNTTCDDISPWSGGKSLYDFINTVHIQGLTGHVKLNHGKRLDFSLDIMELRDNGLRKTGAWQVGKGVNITLKRFGGTGVFGNKTMIVSTMLEAPYAMLRKELHKDVKHTGNDRYEGFCIDLLKEIARIVGFEYKIEVVPDGRYGVRNSDGEWDGIVRQLIDRNVDLSVAALTISYEREQFIDFTKPFLNLGISILFKKPLREKPGLFSFMNPLAIEIWIYVVAAYFVVSLTMFVLARFSPYEWYNPHPCNPETDTVENTFTLSNSLWFCVGTLMQQGSDVNPRAVSTRLVGSTWWLFTLIIISSYTANLAAFLTVERMESPIQSADDLAKQTDISYGTLNGGSTMSFFRNSSIETYQRMWNFMENKGDVFTKTPEEGIERVENENYAFLMESTSIEYNTQRKCNLMQIGGLLDSKGYGVATPMDSPLKDKLSMAVLNLQEEGKIQMLYNKWWKSTGKCNADDKTNSKANSLGVENVGGIFVVLLTGLTLAVFVAMIEFIVKSRSNAAEDKQSVCSEMAEELRFAVRCHGSHKKPKYKTGKCPKCKKRHGARCPQTDNRRESPNGIIAMRESRHSNMHEQDLRDFETEYLHEPTGQFGAGGYLHVDYSDTDT